MIPDFTSIREERIELFERSLRHSGFYHRASYIVECQVALIRRIWAEMDIALPDVRWISDYALGELANYFGAEERGLTLNGGNILMMMRF